MTTDLMKITPWGEKHGLINSVGNSVADNGLKTIDPKYKDKAEKLKADDHRMIKARYLNTRGAHERCTKPYCRWAGDPIETWHFIPGEVYDVWNGLVKEVNSSPGLVKRSEILDLHGVPTKKDNGAEKLHQFVPVDF